MIIKIIPENDAERARMQAVEHTGVKEFFIFGNKKDSESDSIDFHDWTGSYRYLVGSLYYFTNMLAEEMGSKASNKPTEINLRTVPMEVDAMQKGLIKKSGAKDGSIEGVVEIKAENMKEKPQLSLVNDGEMEVEEVVEEDNSKGAEE